MVFNKNAPFFTEFKLLFECFFGVLCKTLLIVQKMLVFKICDKLKYIFSESRYVEDSKNKGFYPIKKLYKMYKISLEVKFKIIKQKIQKVFSKSKQKCKMLYKLQMRI